MSTIVDVSGDAVAVKAAELKRAHGKIGVVAVESGSAFFRRPTADEFDEVQSLQGTDEYRKAYARYVRLAFLGVLAGDGTWTGPEAFPHVLAEEGPGWIAGVAGLAVNRLAGGKERAPSRFF